MSVELVDVAAHLQPLRLRQRGRIEARAADYDHAQPRHTATISSFPFVNQPWVAQLSNGMLSDQFGGQGNGLILPAGVAWAPPQPARPSGQI